MERSHRDRKIIRDCAKALYQSMHCIHCPVDCPWGTDKKCIDALTEYLEKEVLQCHLSQDLGLDLPLED